MSRPRVKTIRQQLERDRILAKRSRVVVVGEMLVTSPADDRIEQLRLIAGLVRDELEARPEILARTRAPQVPRALEVSQDRRPRRRSLWSWFIDWRDRRRARRLVVAELR